MDYNQLVDEILARAAGKLAGLEGGDSSSNQRQILILTEQHGTLCHELLENTKLQTCCHLECAFRMEYNCDLKDYDTVVIYQLSNTALSKLAAGICDTPWISLASKAILMGKTVIIPTDEIELYQYEQTAPGAYYAMMSEKLKLLKDSGVTFCTQNDLEKILTECCPNPESLNPESPKKESPKKEPSVAKERIGIRIDKKVITERDLKKLAGDGVNCICINSNAILTDLAKEYLNYKNITMEREPSTGRKQR